MISDRGFLLGIGIDRGTLFVHTQEVLRAIQESRQIVFACANPHSLVSARYDQTFRSALRYADQVVADGVGVTILAKLIGIKVGPRITGFDYFESVMGALDAKGSGRVFFLGSSEETLTLISKRFKKDYPNLILCGVLSPPYSTWTENENSAIISRINAASPDVIWVGMTAPKQEKWVYLNREKLTSSLIGSIGAVFDFYAGTYTRAPKWMRKVGFEWLFRLLREPRRLWRRNLISTPLFALLIVWNHVILRYYRNGPY